MPREESKDGQPRVKKKRRVTKTFDWTKKAIKDTQIAAAEVKKKQENLTMLEQELCRAQQKLEHKETELQALEEKTLRYLKRLERKRESLDSRWLKLLTMQSPLMKGEQRFNLSYNILAYLEQCHLKQIRETNRELNIFIQKCYELCITQIPVWMWSCLPEKTTRIKSSKLVRLPQDELISKFFPPSNDEPDEEVSPRRADIEVLPPVE